MNKISLVGRIVRDLELKYIDEGKAVVNFTIAVDTYVRSRENNTTDFIPIVAWGKKAETIAKYTKKGSLIGVVGRVQTRSYENKEGIRKYVVEVVAEEIQFLSSSKSEEMEKQA